MCQTTAPATTQSSDLNSSDRSNISIQHADMGLISFIIVEMIKEGNKIVGS